MSELLGTQEKTALIALLLAGEEVSTPELKKHHGFQLKKATRESLVEAKLIASRTEKSPHMHKITPAGVEKCEEVLVSMKRAPGGSTLLGVIFELLTPIVKYLRQHGKSLADVLHAANATAPTAPTAPAPSVTLESLIRQAYAELSTKRQDWVRLAKLRSKLNGAEKHEVDQVLLAMTRTGLVHLAPDSDRKSLTEADRTAAIRIGKEDKHLVAIEES